MPALTALSAELSVRPMQHWADFLSKPGLKKAVTNFGWLLVERGVRLVLGLVVGIFVVRHLGPERLGALSYCLAIVTLLGCVPALGLDAPVKRELLQHPDSAGALLAGAALARWVASALAYGVVLVVAMLGWGITGIERQLLLVVGLLLFQPPIWVADLWLQARLRARIVVSVQLAALAIASAVRVGLILQNASVTAFAWALVLEVALGGVGLLWAARRDGLRLHWRGVEAEGLRRLLAESWPLLFASLAILIYMKTDEVMLRHLAGPAAVGTYAAAARLSEMWYFLPIAVASSVLPALIRARQAGPEAYAHRLQQYFDGSAAAAYLLAIPVALISPWIVRLAYGEAFAAAGPILSVHIWSSIFVFLGVARGQWLVNEGLQRFYLAATCAGAVVNVILNFAFIPKWGGLGAAYATVISYAIAGWLASYFHPVVRATARMQTRALLIPFRAREYVRSR